jgi:hypothetical protein
MATVHIAVPAAIDDAGVLHRSQPLVGPVSGVLHCAGCRTLVEAVQPHERTIGDLHVEVRGHFRLAPGHAHAVTCPFDFPRAAARIARAAPAIIRPLPAGYAVKMPDAPARIFRPSARSWRPGRAGSTSTFMAGEAVVTIGKVAALLERFGGQHAAPGAFTAAWGRQAIDWPEFCFDDASHVELVERLHAGNWPWPFAVLFDAERAGQSKAGTSWWAGQTTDQHTILDGQPVAIRVTVRSRTPGPIRALELGAPALGFGSWQLYRPPTRPQRRGPAIADAVLWINQPWQLLAAAP